MLWRKCSPMLLPYFDIPLSRLGADKVPASVEKFLGLVHPEERLSMVDFSLEATWLHLLWKSSKIQLIKKKSHMGFAIDDLR